MKNLMKNLVVLSVVCFSLLAPTALFAQQWSAAQKEVWKNVEAYWAPYAAGDLEGFLAYVHPDYLGWEYTDAVPGDKASIRKWIAQDFKTTKTLVYEINPLGIKIHGDIALVHYYWSQRTQDAEGKVKDVSGRWTDILMKRGDKWVLIGDHGGETSKD